MRPQQTTFIMQRTNWLKLIQKSNKILTKNYFHHVRFLAGLVTCSISSSFYLQISSCFPEFTEIDWLLCNINARNFNKKTRKSTYGFLIIWLKESITAFQGYNKWSSGKANEQSVQMKTNYMDWRRDQLWLT